LKFVQNKKSERNLVVTSIFLISSFFIHKISFTCENDIRNILVTTQFLSLFLFCTNFKLFYLIAICVSTTHTFLLLKTINILPSLTAMFSETLWLLKGESLRKYYSFLIIIYCQITIIKVIN
jgi:hypothetical protein